jgi:outer membrane protein assembly factor BamB
LSIDRGRRGLLLAAAPGLAALAACGGSPKPKPTPLEPVTAQIAGRIVWQRRLDGLPEGSVFGVAGGAFAAAGADGTVVSLDPETGRDRWRAAAGAAVTSGAGSDGRYAAVVTRGGDLAVFDGGRALWRNSLGLRVVTAPLVAGERVFVLATNRSVHAFDVLDGRKIWTLQRPGDPLTLTQTGVLAPFRDTLLVGQGSRLTGVDPTRGAVRWEVPMATPRGANEIERLADLVGPLARQGDLVCARAYQAAVSCVNADRASLAWTRPIAGLNGVSVDDGVLVAADISDRVGAWRSATGEPMWTQERLLHRGLSAPLLVGRTVMVGDVEGWVHFLSRETGALQLRLATDGSPIVAAPAAIGTTVLVGTRNGGLFALRPE